MFCAYHTFSIIAVWIEHFRHLLLSHMPFQKNFPSLGTTTRLRIPEKVAPHFESVLEHLNRQVQLLGQDYIEAFFFQCSQAMKELESASTSLSNTPLEKLNHQELKKHFIEQYTLESNSHSSNDRTNQGKTFSAEQIKEYCSAIRESFEELKNQSQSSSLGAWKIIEFGLTKRQVHLDHIDIFHEVCYGFLEPSRTEFESIATRYRNQCPLVESFWDIKDMRAFKPLLKTRELIARA